MQRQAPRVPLQRFLGPIWQDYNINQSALPVLARWGGGKAKIPFPKMPEEHEEDILGSRETKSEVKRTKEFGGEIIHTRYLRLLAPARRSHIVLSCICLAFAALASPFHHHRLD